MDYLVFMLGLFLLSAAAGAIMLYRQKPRLNRWIWLAVGLSSLAFQTWSGLLTFASGAEPSSIILLNATFGAIFCSCLVRFALNGTLTKQKLLRVARLAAILIVLVTVFLCEVRLPHSTGVLILSSLLAFAAGWRIPSWRLRPNQRQPKFTTQLWSAIIFSIIPVVCMLPETVETAYDIYGKGQSTTRSAMVLALAAAAGGALVLAFLLWRPVVEPVDLELSANLRRRKRIGTTIILTAAMITVTNGAWLAYWLGNQAQQEQVDTLISAINLGATTLESNLIPLIQGNPEETRSEAYLTLRSRLINIHQALPKTRFVYLVGMRDEHLVFLVDAENPTSRDFSPPGTPLVADPQKWLNTLGGSSYFGGPAPDEWGVWFTATLPIYAPGKRQAVAALGVDYPASEWLRPYAARRLAAMGVTVSVASLLLALYLLHLASIAHTSRVDQLSERLTDAMKAAEFDTWEWFPKTLRLGMGERISTMLGWSNHLSLSPLRQVWRRVHPEDRRQLLELLRSEPDEKTLSSEAEIRLRDSQGRWLWFMLRGRVVNEDHESGDSRVVGTILNIDESYRSRIEIDKQRRFALHVMESVPNGLAVVSPDGLLAYANAAFIRLSRRSESQLIGMPLQALMRIPENAKGGRAGFEATLQCLDGTDVDVQAFQAPLEESGQQAGFILSIVDLTNIKDTELALRRSRAEADRLAFVAKRTDNAVLITDTRGRIEWANEGFTRMSGYTREELVGKPEGHLLGRTNASHAALSDAARKLAAGQGFETETENITKDGRSYLVHIECQPLFDNHGILTGFMAIKRDITRTRRSATLLEAVASISTSLLSDSFEASMWQHIMEALGRAAMVNQSFLFSIHENPKTGMPWMSHMADWQAGRSTRQLDSDTAVQSFDLQANGCMDWFNAWSAGHDIAGTLSDFPAHQQTILRAQNIRSLVMVPIFAGDNLWGMLGFNVKTEDRQWEAWEIAIMRSAAANIGLRVVAQNESDALRLARDEANSAANSAERANKAKSTFLATMSHEIRTPLNAVIGIASLLETTDLNDQQKDYAETILRSSHFLLELINDILDYSRIESGKIELESSQFSLPDLCREVFEVVRVSSIGKEIEMVCRIDPTIPENLIGDSGRLRQILVNLLGNAVKFTHGGFVFLEVTGLQIEDGRWRVDFYVKDSGIGIAPASKEKLFKPFIQEDSSTTRRFGGSGLGLAISKRLAQLMHGDITVESTQGVGSTFIASACLLGISEPRKSTQINPFIARNHPRILIVDDHDLNRRILGEVFSNWGLHCQSAGSAEEAIAICRKFPPFDLILTDFRMPGMNGAQLAETIKSLHQNAQTRYVLLGSDTSYPAEVRDCFDEICSKPIWPSSIAAILGKLFPSSEKPKHAPAPTTPEPNLLSGLRVLVAEDNPNNQKVVRLLLRRMGIDPEIVDDGKQAVEAVAVKDYDVVFMDIQMPIMDGLEASARIKSSNLAHRPYVIALTANAFHEDRDAAAAAGMDGYLSKPITLAGLRKTLLEITQTTPN